MIDRRQVLESIATDPTATASDRMRAMKELDHLADDDGRGFTRSEIDDLSDEELDALVAEPTTIQDSAERIARELLHDTDVFQREVRVVAEQMAEHLRAEALEATRRAVAAEQALALARSRRSTSRREKRSQTPATERVELNAMHEAEIVALNAWPDEPRRPFGRA